METRRLSPDAAGIAEAAALLVGGALVAFPTETVYGLGGDARSPDAVDAIYRAKGRPAENPLIVHVAGPTDVVRLAAMPPEAERLAATFWPGALTLVLPLAPGAELAPAVTAGLGTVAIRMPDHPVARALLRAAERPVAAPSANPSGRVSPTSPAHVLDGLAGRIAAVLDAGPCPVGLESTIIRFDDEIGPRLLRPGGIPAEALEEVLGRPLATAGEPEATRPTAPGQLPSHYAPGVRLRLNASQPGKGEGWLGLGPVPPGVSGPALSLSRRRDLGEAAANLFGHLRAIDAAMGGRGILAVGPIPETGLGRAINDRLARAAAPRPAARGSRD